MLERIAGVVVLLGLVLSVVGAILGNENIKTTGVLVLLITATVAGYRFLKFYVSHPTQELVGICTDQKRLSSHYVLTFRTGAGIYSGQANLKLGAAIRVGEKARLKVKGHIITEIGKV